MYNPGIFEWELRTRMRFRAKFGTLGWIWVGFSSLIVTLWLSGLRHSPIEAVLLLCFLLTLQRIFSHIFIYWEATADSMKECRYWNTNVIPWSEVIHIGPWPQHQPSSDYLEIKFNRAAPLSECGHVIANPEDRGSFIAALHRFASHAEFEV
jgi:hypothetical protein